MAREFTMQGPDGANASISELRAGFQQGFVFELYDLATQQTVPNGVHVMVLNPKVYRLTEPLQSVLTPAEDNTVVAEETGIITRDIVLEGTFGLKKRRPTGIANAQGAGDALSGTEHFNELRNLFRRYSAFKKDPNRAANIIMIFHALRDDDHFIVVPKQFETPRDAKTTRVHHEYRISLTAIEEADQSGLVRASSRGFQIGDIASTLDTYLNEARSAFAEVTASMADIKRKVANIEAVMINAAGIINAVSNFVTGTTALVNMPLQAVATGAESIGNASDRLIESLARSDVALSKEGELGRSLRRIETAFDQVRMFDEIFVDTFSETENAFDGESRLTPEDIERREAGATIGTRTRLAAGVGAEGLDVSTGTGVELVEVSRTDTVESIASRAGASPEAIILINNLQPPYITPQGGPGIAKPGDRILVPTFAVENNDTTRTTRDYIDSETVLFGVDLGLDKDHLERTGKFDLGINRTRDDATRSRGIENVVQGLQIIVKTERNSTVFIPHLGIRRTAGAKGTLGHVLHATVALRESILLDPRIEGIDSLSVELVEDVLTQNVIPRLRGYRGNVKLTLPFGTASGGN